MPEGGSGGDADSFLDEDDGCDGGGAVTVVVVVVVAFCASC